MSARFSTKSERGSVIVFSALMLVVALGFAAIAFDFSRILIARQRGQMICDAAALAGARYLTGQAASTAVNGSSGAPAPGDGDAAKAAKYVALANNEMRPAWTTHTVGYGSAGISVSFPPYPATQGTIPADDGTPVSVRLGEAIKTEAVIRVPLTFAQIFGMDHKDVHTQAVAIVGLQANTPTTVTGNALPWAVADSTIWVSGSNPPQTRINMGDRMTLKITGPGDPAGFMGPGNFLAVAYGGDHGANDYRDRIASTQNITFHLDQLVNLELETEPGNISGPTEQGLTTRLGSDVYPYPSADATAWNNWLNSYNPSTGRRTDTRRIGIVPIVQDPGGDLSGRRSLTVVGFAGVFIEGMGTYVQNGTTYTQLTARFTGGIYSANGVFWLDPGTSPPYSSTVTSVRLLS